METSTSEPLSDLDPLESATWISHSKAAIYSNRKTICLIYFRQGGYVIVVMVALWNRADHYIFALSFVYGRPM